MKTMEQGLKKARVLGKFKRNFIAYRSKGSIEYLPEFLGYTDNQLYKAFPFSHTPEGHDFWIIINKKLNQFLSNDNS